MVAESRSSVFASAGASVRRMNAARIAHARRVRIMRGALRRASISETARKSRPADGWSTIVRRSERSLDYDANRRVTELDLVARLDQHAARIALRHANRLSPANHHRAMQAAVVEHVI